jgi:predicted TIM-barrel fold metal-dependent hydrolase
LQSPLPPIIDTHTHFYDPSRPQGVPWPAKGDALLYRTVSPKEFIGLGKPLGIVGTVVVEASPWVEDNQYVLDLAKDEPFLLGLIGNLKPGDPAFGEHFARFAKNPKFLGIRIAGDGWRARVGEGRYLDDLKRLADSALTLDINTNTAGLTDAARLADRLPELRVVLNHCGNLAIDGKETPATWRSGIAALAGRANVWAKLSGLVEGTARRSGDAPADLAFYRPVLDVMWNAFGPAKLVFGSNWPVSARFAPLDLVVNLARQYVETKAPAAARAVFVENAVAAYRWPAASNG